MVKLIKFLIEGKIKNKEVNEFAQKIANLCLKYLKTQGRKVYFNYKEVKK